MIASLPMYDWTEVQPAYDAFWQAIRNRLEEKDVAAPMFLSREIGEDKSWNSPDLLLGQTCGYPFATSLKDKVRYLATPVYKVDGCEGPTYSSAVVAKRDSCFSIDGLENCRFAFNSRTSLSGYRAMSAMTGEPTEFFSSLVESGSHRQSARDVVSDRADIAAIDAVCWHLLRIHEAATADQLKVIGWTEKRPSLPLITSLKTSAEVVAKLREAINDVTSADECRDICKTLAISRFEAIDLEKYSALAAL